MSKSKFFILSQLSLLVYLSSCRPLDMYDQEKYETYEKSEIFPDGRVVRHPPSGTVPRGQEDRQTQLASAQLAQELPFSLNRKQLERGQERYRIHCSPCHGISGHGDGMIVLRGYSKPPSFHSERLRLLPVGHFYRVISEGFGAMPAYGKQVRGQDRWLITAYIRALQLSQQAPLEALSDDERKQLEVP